MNTAQIGRDAEDASANFLFAKGYKILDRNWRTRWCEIDIVAIKNKIVYFVEVKYRKNSIYGDGLDAISVTKLRQMNFAADLWVNSNQWNGTYELAVISATGKPVNIENFIIV